MPQVPKLPPAPAGCRWRPTTEGDYRINPDRRYYSPGEAIQRGSAYWELLDPQGRNITLEQAPNWPPPPAGGAAAALPGPTEPLPTRGRQIRVSGSPNWITIYGTFSPRAEIALANGWLSQYEYSFLEQLLPGPCRGGTVSDALDLLEVLRQVRLRHGYRPGPGPNQVDDLYNLGYYGSSASRPTIVNYSQLPQNGSILNSFVSLFNQAQSTGLKPFGVMNPARLAAVNAVINARLAQIANSLNLAPEDRTVLQAIQVVSLMNWMVPSPPPPPALPPPPGRMALTVGGVVFNFPALDSVQQAAFKACLDPRSAFSNFGRGGYGSGSLLPLRRFAQPILDSVFRASGGRPAGWQWPVLP